MKRAALYIRVSTARQDQEGYSIPVQKERLLSYCKAMGWVVTGVFADPGHSGSTIDRPGIISLIDGVRDKRFDVVLVYKLDRLSRSQRDTLYLIEEVFEPAGVAFVSMQESFDTSSVYGRAMLGVLSVFAQMERETITERTLMGRAGRAEGGLWHGGGTDPIGYDYIDGALVVNREEADQVLSVYKMYSQGYSLSEIIRRMDGCSTKHGEWTHTSTVGNVLDNPLYSGMIHFNGVMVQGQHDPIVPREIDRRVKDRRARLRRLDTSEESEHFLTSLIYCGSCGARYFPLKRKSGRVVYSCHSRAKKNRKMVKDPNCKAPHIPVETLDAMVEVEILRLVNDPSLIESIKKRTAESGSLADRRSNEVERIDKEINKLMDLYQNDDLISVADVAARVEKLHQERMSLSPRSDALDVGEVNASHVRSILREIKHEWFGLTKRGKRAFLLQLVNGIFINDGDLVVDWSF